MAVNFNTGIAYSVYGSRLTSAMIATGTTSSINAKSALRLVSELHNLVVLLPSRI
jgi:hypothetical protein